MTTTTMTERVTTSSRRPGGRKGRQRRTPRQRALQAILYVLLAVVALFPLLPLYWLLISALKAPAEFSQVPPTWFPANPTLEQAEIALTAVPFFQSMLNSMIIAGGATISTLVTSILAGYVFAKHTFRGRDLLFWTLVSTMFLPPIVTLVPLYYLVDSMGLSDSHIGVMLPWLANAFGIFLMRQFIRDVPDELIEAARVDGAGEFRIVWQFVVPLLKPAVVTLAVFMFVYSWNNFIWPLSILRSEALYPVVLTLNRLMSYTMSFEYQNVVLAGAIIASLPTLIIFFITQRVFVAGIAASGPEGSLAAASCATGRLPSMPLRTTHPTTFCCRGPSSASRSSKTPEIRRAA